MAPRSAVFGVLLRVLFCVLFYGLFNVVVVGLGVWWLWISVCVVVDWGWVGVWISGGGVVGCGGGWVCGFTWSVVCGACVSGVWCWFGVWVWLTVQGPVWVWVCGVCL